MRKSQWEQILKAARGEPQPAVPAAFIADSPWIPPYLSISTVDYIAEPETWLNANLTVMNRFPEAVFLPGFWVEPGMAAEPSGFGCPVSFSDAQPPSIHPIGDDIADLDDLQPPNPLSDGLMPLVLSHYRHAVPRVRALGMDIKIAAVRGPLALAAHLIGLTAFLVGLKTEPARTARLLDVTTRAVKEWLDAQLQVLPGAEGVLVLDDVVGFLSRDDYREFAHPHLKDVFNVKAAVKAYHNDADSSVCYEFLHDLGVNVFNFTHLRDIQTVRGLVGDNVCLMGNVPPLDVLAQGTREESGARARACLNANKGHPAFMLSAGGGVSPGTPGENLKAVIEAARNGASGA
jgi:uroporphyrinogen decarboxylase